ncbi:MAG: response regulator, partial [Ktedonobacteraceae bacterium]
MGTPLSVLIVEDSEDDALLLLHEIKRGGYDPTFERVETPQAMKVALDRHKWDIVISDYVMPHFSGLAALELLQRNRLDMPFIIVSGNIGEDMAADAMKTGANDYVMKSNLSRLTPAIKRELREAVVRQEHKRAEEALQKSESLLQLQINRMPIGCILWNSEFCIGSWNPAAEEIFGFKADEVLGKHPYSLIVPKDVQPHIDIIWRRLLEGDAIAHSVNENITKDGRIIVCSWS